MHANSRPQQALTEPPLPERGSESGYANMPVTKVPGWHGIIAWDALLNGMATGLFLAAAVSELAAPIYRSRELTCFAQDDTGVTIELSDGESLRASYLVGCDGGRSLVRKAAGIEFRGWDATTSSILAEVEMAEEPPLGVHRTALGIHAFGREKYEIRDGKIVFASEGPIGVMVTEKNVGATTELTLRDLSEALVAACGTDYGIHSPTWISRFTDMSRQAAAYRKGRVLLAGDAAHVLRWGDKASILVCRMQ